MDRGVPRMTGQGVSVPERVALVQGASRGLGLALVEHLLERGACARIYASCRHPSAAARLSALAAADDRLEVLRLDVTDPETIAAAARRVEMQSRRLDLLINSAGVLHDADGLEPEKRLADVEGAAMARAFQVNAVGALLVAQAFQGVLQNSREARFAALSARVGSIRDNRRGGWYAYRASKAALNMMIRTLAIEWRRLPRPIACFALHPGTVATDLSAPFLKRLPDGPAVAPAHAAARLLRTLLALSPSESGGFFAYDGSAIEW